MVLENNIKANYWRCTAVASQFDGTTVLRIAVFGLRTFQSRIAGCGYDDRHERHELLPGVAGAMEPVEALK